MASVFINGRSAVHQNSGGVLTTYDICLTGPHHYPIQYLNIAYSSDAAQTATSVIVNGWPICHKASYFSSSQGDEAGSYGIHSGTIQGKAEFVSYSPNVFCEGEALVRAGDMMVSNNRNTPPGQLIQA